MSSITLHFPSALEAFLHQRTSEGFTSIEEYFITLAESDRRLQMESETMVKSLAPEAKSALDQLLAQRDQGPFVPLDTEDDAHWDQIKQEGRRRAANAHA